MCGGGEGFEAQNQTKVCTPKSCGEILRGHRYRPCWVIAQCQWEIRTQTRGLLTGLQCHSGSLVVEVRFPHRYTADTLPGCRGDQVQQGILIRNSHHHKVIGRDAPVIDHSGERSDDGIHGVD